jgi:hypothetical protein
MDSEIYFSKMKTLSENKFSFTNPMKEKKNKGKSKQNQSPFFTLHNKDKIRVLCSEFFLLLKTFCVSVCVCVCV